MAGLELDSPVFIFNWGKEAGVDIPRVEYGNCVLIVKEPEDSIVESFKRYYRFGDVLSTYYSEENFKRIEKVMIHGVNSLFVLALKGDETLTAEHMDIINGDEIQYGTFPEASETEISVIKSSVKDLRTNFNSTLKWLFAEPSILGETQDDEYFFIFFGADEIVLADGTTGSNEDLLPTIMGQRAALPLSKSLTHKQITGVISVKRYRDQKARLSKGVMTAFIRNGSVQYPRDINGMTTLGEDRDKRFRQNQRIASMDTINADIRKVWKDVYAGNFINNRRNKNNFCASVNAYFYARAKDETDPVEYGKISIDLEEHRNILRRAGKTEAYIANRTTQQLEAVDTDTFVYVTGEAYVGGVMEDCKVFVKLALEVGEEV